MLDRNSLEASVANFEYGLPRVFSRRLFRFCDHLPCEEASANRDISQMRVLINVQVTADSLHFGLPYWLASLKSLHCQFLTCEVDFYTIEIVNGTRIGCNPINVELRNDLAELFNGTQFVLLDSNKSNGFMSYSSNLRPSHHEPAGSTHYPPYDFVFLMSTHHYITNKGIFQILANKNKLLAVPLLDMLDRRNQLASSLSDIDAQISCTSHGWLQSGIDRDSVIGRTSLGCFELTSICDLPVMIDVNLWAEWRIPGLFPAYAYQQPIINETFMKSTAISFHVCNRNVFGYTVLQPVQHYVNGSRLDDATSEELLIQATEHLLLEYQLKGTNKTYQRPFKTVHLPLSTHNDRRYTLDCVDKIYVINLRRRTDRLERIKYALKTLGLKAQIVEAYDGTLMSPADLEKLYVKPITDYIDPYNKRHMNLGEVACSLSHHWIWKDAYKHQYKRIAVFEDDVRFGYLFKYLLNTTLAILDQKKMSWDMLYLGRKIMDVNEIFVDEVPNLLRPNYSHWTIAYMLTRSGLGKLLRQNFLSNMLPVDEFLPLMYDQQPMTHLKKFFPKREILTTYAFQPSIVQPTHYYGEANYVSDTENITTAQ